MTGCGGVMEESHSGCLVPEFELCLIPWSQGGCGGVGGAGWGWGGILSPHPDRRIQAHP